jgi:hypothetical protein
MERTLAWDDGMVGEQAAERCVATGVNRLIQALETS